MLMDTIRVLDSASEIKKQDGTSKWLGASLYDLAGSTLTKPTDGATLTRFSVSRAFKLPAGLVGSYAESTVAPTSSVTYTIHNNGSTALGTINFAAGQNIATFTMATEQSLVVGDILTVEAPATADATHDNIAWTFAGKLL
jgi:hypothetical protein